MPSYHHCNHQFLLVSAHRAMGTDGTSERHEVRLCRVCGLFQVYGNQRGQHFDVSFTLPTDELVYAAGQYARYLQEREDTARLTPRSVWPGEASDGTR